MNTKIFCDIAELSQIKKFVQKKIVKGFTTNPSLMKKAGAKDYKSYSKKILKICNNKFNIIICVNIAFIIYKYNKNYLFILYI